MRKKASVTLSINFLVTFILAITIFGFGLILAKQIFSGSQGIADKTFEDLDKQIGSLTCSGSEKICFTAKQKRIERGAFAVFGLSVRNVFPDKRTFEVTIAQGLYIDMDQMSTSPPDAPVIGLLPHSRTLVLDSKESDTMGIGVEIPKDAPSGTYVLNIDITYDADTHSVDSTNPSYGSTRKLYVKVP